MIFVSLFACVCVGCMAMCVVLCGAVVIIIEQHACVVLVLVLTVDARVSLVQVMKHKTLSHKMLGLTQAHIKEVVRICDRIESKGGPQAVSLVSSAKKASPSPSRLRARDERSRRAVPLVVSPHETRPTSGAKEGRSSAQLPNDSPAFHSPAPYK